MRAGSDCPRKTEQNNHGGGQSLLANIRETTFRVPRQPGWLQSQPNCKLTKHCLENLHAALDLCPKTKIHTVVVAFRWQFWIVECMQESPAHPLQSRTDKGICAVEGTARRDMCSRWALDLHCSLVRPLSIDSCFLDL